MKKLIFLLCILIPVSCSNSSLEIRLIKKHDSINKEFEPYIKEFIFASRGKVTEKKFKRLTMGFRDLSKKGNTVGVCHPFIMEIDISASWWRQTTSPMEKMELVFHELGHCILRRGHTYRPVQGDFRAWLEDVGFKLGIFQEKHYLSDGCPASFMHPQMMGEHCVNKHFYYYIEELFDRHQWFNYVDKNFTERNPSSEKCEEPEVVNETNNWGKKDSETLARMKVRCLEEYETCLKIFIKKTSDNYLAICK